MNNPKIHIIIPVYNAERYLAEAVESVLAQPCDDLMLYLIDDGSRDGSAALCDALALEHANIRVLHQPNSGVSAARNAGIDLAMEQASDLDYLAFCDADDRWLPNTIRPDFFTGPERYDMHTFGEYCGDQELNRFYVYSSFCDRVELNIEKILWEPSHFCASLYSCALIRSYGIRFTRTTKYIEDFMFVTQCRYCARSIRYHSEFLYLYRHNASSAMHTRHRISKIDYYTQIINGWMETQEKINACADRTGRTTTIGSTLASIYFLDMAAAHYQQWGSRKALEQVFRTHPHFHLFENMDPKSVNARQYRDHLQLKQHHLRFRLKNSLIGIFTFLMETAYRLPPVKAFYIHRKYKMTQIPENRSVSE